MASQDTLFDLGFVYCKSSKVGSLLSRRLYLSGVGVLLLGCGEGQLANSIGAQFARCVLGFQDALH